METRERPGSLPAPPLSVLASQLDEKKSPRSHEPRNENRQLTTRAQRAWLGTAVVLTLSVWLVLHYLRATEGWSPRAATPLGRWYGGIGAGLMLILTLYWARRANYRRRFGRLELWYRTHLWIGLIALALVGAHCGFRCRGVFLTTLQIFFWGAMATGLLGWLLQTWMKRQLARYEDRPLVLAELQRESARTRERLPSCLATVSTAEWDRILASFAGLRRRNLCRFPSWVSWEAMVTTQAGRALSHHLNSLDPVETGAVLAALERINRIEVIASYHRWLRGWTTLHLALALGVAQLVLWHIYATTWY